MYCHSIVHKYDGMYGDYTKDRQYIVPILHVSKNLAILILIYPSPYIFAQTPKKHPELLKMSFESIVT